MYIAIITITGQTGGSRSGIFFSETKDFFPRAFRSVNKQKLWVIAFWSDHCFWLA